jgi:hypothetical protein
MLAQAAREYNQGSVLFLGVAFDGSREDNAHPSALLWHRLRVGPEQHQGDRRHLWIACHSRDGRRGSAGHGGVRAMQSAVSRPALERAIQGVFN